MDGGLPGDVNSYGRAEVPAVPEQPGDAQTYEGTYISENGGIWYIPLGDGVLESSIDAGSSAVDYGDGTVGLPYTNNPFTVGQTVQIETTDNYDGIRTVRAGTTTSELRITDTYVAEVFDGTETVIRRVAANLPSGGARMARDSSGNLYYAHQAQGTVPNVYYVTRVAQDGTESPSTNWLTFEFNDGSSCRGIVVSPDDAFIFIWLSSLDIYKFNLATGVLVWQSAQPDGFHGYNIALDADGNAYTAKTNTNGSSAAQTNKFDADDGTHSSFLNSEGTYDVIVDDDMSVIITVGWHTGRRSNLWCTSLDQTENDEMAVGGYTVPLPDPANTWVIDTGAVTTFDGNIYVISETPTATLYKIAWDGSSLSLVNSVAGPTRGIGIYFDLYDNLVVVNQSFGNSVTDVFHYYDTDLNALSFIDNFDSSLLRSWDATATGTWLRGGVHADGELAGPNVPEVPAVPGVDANYVDVDPYLAGVEVCVYADGVNIGTRTAFADANGTIVIDVNDTYDVVIAGLNYWSKLETMPLKTGSRIADKKLNAIRFDLEDAYYLEYAMGANATPMVCDFGEVITSNIKYNRVAFPFGSMKKATVYIQTDEPVPLGIRAIIPEVTSYGPR